MIDRAERSLTAEDVAAVAGKYHAWRGTRSAAGAVYTDEPGFCYSATLAEIKTAEYSLTPGRFVGAAETHGDIEEVGRANPTTCGGH